MRKGFLLFVFVILGIFIFFLLANSKKIVKIKSTMKITSSAFANNAQIPSTYTCDAKGINPFLSFEDVPNTAKSLVLIVDDPDAPMGTFVHWVVFNIPPTTTEIAEDSIPPGIEGVNSTGKQGFIGPCPPNGTHRYFFKLYALDNTLSLDNKANKQMVENAMQGHIIDQAELVGLYHRK